ncbi:MAG: DegT/DnrJ/EryC1/StrS aminotransferase family protein [Gammaproteobacteria bacterium]|nr:DegT/DnrJ/EryC1/StrS aminotransferase family protein [Gammaproteobacteria bacterium]
METEFIPFSLPSIGEEEINEVVDTLRSGWLTTGPKTRQFEEEFAQYVGVKHAIAINSATAGLHLSLEALGISEGDKVVTTTYTFTATAEVVRYLGADPVFVDVDPITANIDIEKLAGVLEKIEGIKAIIPVHFAGQSCELDKITQLAKKYSVGVVEDSAHAFPATYNGKKIGTFSEATVFSFYANKTITTGEGGMITTDNDALAERVRVMRLHGINRDVFNRYHSRKPAWYYEVVAPGFKYNLTDIAASIGIHQLRKAEALRNRREQIAQVYNEAFKDLPLELPRNVRETDVHSWHLYVVRIKANPRDISRDRFIELLAEKNIGSSVHFIPLHLQPYWRDHYGLNSSDFPVAQGIYESAVSLPNFADMTDVQVNRVISAVREIFESCS